MGYTYIPNVISQIIFSSDGPQPQTLFAEGPVKVVSVGLQAGQIIPSHPEGLAVYTFLDGNGWMVVDGNRLAVGPGSIVITQSGAFRGIEADHSLIIIGVRIAEIPH